MQMCYLNKYWNYQQVIWKQNFSCHKCWKNLCRCDWLRILPYFVKRHCWKRLKPGEDYHRRQLPHLNLWIVHSALIFIMILTVPVLQTTPTSVCHLQIKPSVKCPKLIVFKNSSNVTTYNLDHVYLVICQTLGLLGWLYLIPNRDYSLHIAWSPYNLFTACLVPCGQLVRKLWSQHILGDAPTEYDLST